MNDKTLWHPATEFPKSGAYVLVVYNDRYDGQTLQQKIAANYFEVGHGEHAMVAGFFHPTYGDELDKRTCIPGVKYPKRTPQTNAAIVDIVAHPLDFWRNVKCWAYGEDIFATIPKNNKKPVTNSK